jgi:hypothetical protein
MEDLFAAQAKPTHGRIDADSLKYLLVHCFDKLIGKGFCIGCFFRLSYYRDSPAAQPSTATVRA